MVQGHAGDDADLVARFLRVLGDELEGGGQGHIVVDDAGQGLFTGGDGGGGGGGVRAEGGCVVGGHHAQIGEGGEAQVCGNREFGVGICNRALVVLGGGHLGVAHAVADEHEHVFRGRSGLLSRRGGDACQHKRQDADQGNRLFHTTISFLSFWFGFSIA